MTLSIKQNDGGLQPEAEVYFQNIMEGNVIYYSFTKNEEETDLLIRLRQ